MDGRLNQLRSISNQPEQDLLVLAESPFEDWPADTLDMSKRNAIRSLALASPLTIPESLPQLAEVESPSPRRRFLWLLPLWSLPYWLGYLVSGALHGLTLCLLATWVFTEEPAHTEPLTMAAQEAGEETAIEQLASSQHAAAAAGETSFAPQVFVVDTPLEIAGPRLATGLAEAIGNSRGAATETVELVGGETKVGPTVNFFGSSATGNKFVFVIDASGSMNDGSRFQRAATELVTALDSLTEEQQFFVVAFNERTYPMFDLPWEQIALMPGTAENKERLKMWLSMFRPTGWTDPRDAMALALRLSPSAIFFLSDGEFKMGPPERKLGYETLSQVNRANRNRVPIHTLAFEDQANAPTLRGMARASAGTYKFVPPESKHTAKRRNP